MVVWVVIDGYGNDGGDGFEGFHGVFDTEQAALACAKAIDNTAYSGYVKVHKVTMGEWLNT